MTAQDNQAHKKKILILLASGFEEGSSIYCLDRMREAGLPVSVVGISAGWIKGVHGVTVRTDYSLDQLTPEMPYQLVVVSGGRQCVSSLLADPRVRRLFESTLKNEGFVATMLSAELALVQAGIPALSTDSHFVQQGNMNIDEFTNRLIELVLE